ncbi:MAG: hypothetical protein H0W84_11940 [Bacteroidetes bacterium]|nr:hypothetical protein [Bacteroidota bacterium]
MKKYEDEKEHCKRLEKRTVGKSAIVTRIEYRKIKKAFKKWQKDKKAPQPKLRLSKRGMRRYDFNHRSN